MESTNAVIDVTSLEMNNDQHNASTSSKESETESVDAIRKFLDAQDNHQKDTDSLSFGTAHDDSMDSKVSQCETLSVAGSVMDMIISETEMEISKKKDVRSKIISPEKGNGSMALSVGSKVEAKDFGEDWYSAEIIEVDYDEMEVLVHYENNTKRPDEWINVSSPRLRPIGSSTVRPGPSSVDSVLSDTMSPTTLIPKEEVKEVKVEQKDKPAFEVGERCLARWRDNRRFVATIRNELENGSYEIIFDDGCLWTCSVSRLYKLRPGKGGASSEASSSPLPNLEYGAGPSNMTPQANTYSAYHTHLFDPTRDYLGSKSERREKKRKLNIKEIFNIGQKRPRTQKIQKEKPPVVRKTKVVRRKPLKLKKEIGIKTEVIKPEIPAVDAVASIIGTVKNEETSLQFKLEESVTPEAKPEELIEMEIALMEETEIENDIKSTEVVPKSTENTPKSTEDTPGPTELSLESTGVTLKSTEVVDNTETIAESEKIQLEDLKPYIDPEVLEEEMKLEKFEKPDETKHEEVIDRIKEAINKLEDGLSKVDETGSPTPEPTPDIPAIEHNEPNTENIPPATEEITPVIEEKAERDSNKLTKVKKGKKLRLIREKKVDKQVEKVRNELEQMKKQMDEMRKQIRKRRDLTKEEMPASFLLPGEWCCKWVNGQPVGRVSEMECEKQDPTGKPPLPRRSVQVEDERLPEGWTKHMVRRSLGNSAGKWDVVLVSPENRRFHTKNEMRVYLENNQDLMSYEHALTDFGVHLKLARRMGWIAHTPDGIVEGPDNQLSPGTLSSTSPLVKRRSLSLKKGIKVKSKRPKLTMRVKIPEKMVPSVDDAVPSTSAQAIEEATPTVDPNLEALNTPTLEDGYVYVGSLKVQIIENLLRCPAEGCFKNFRNNTLLQMHIKHYHRELRKMMGATPKVLDLAYARARPEAEPPRANDQKTIKVKIPRPPKPKPPTIEKEEPKLEINVDKIDIHPSPPSTPVREGEIVIPRSQDSPKLRQALSNKPVKRPRVLLPVRRVEPDPVMPDVMNEDLDLEMKEPSEPVIEIPSMDALDYEIAISSHMVSKPVIEKKRKPEKRKKSFVLPPRGPMSEEEEWFAASSDVDTRSSFPRSGSPDSKMDKAAMASSESNEENKDNNMYMYNDNGERVKIVHMKREEIINCHCGFREEDGLMVQCELCLCWQHALCHNIQRATDVPEKYTCSICLNPRRGRRSQRFLHDQDRVYEGLLAAGKPCDSLRRSHELAGNLLRIEDALHALRVKYYVAVKKDHPKLYLWAKDWEHIEIQHTQEKLNSDYSDLNIMISNVGKENLPVKPDDIPLDIRALPSDDNEHDRFGQPLGSQALLSGLLSSPGGASLDLPISTSELERLAKTVQDEQESPRPVIAAPQPEAAIENSACRARLLKHLQRCQALIDARLDSIEAQVAELESQDPSFEDDETADYFPRTKQTIQMLMRDLDTMEELAVVT